MSWFNSEGKSPHHVIFSETRYSRNLASVRFPKKAESAAIERFFEKAEALLTKNGFRKEELPEGAMPELSALAEKGFIDRDFLMHEGKRSLFFNEPCNLAVSLGGSDLINIRSILSGNAIPETRNIAAGAEELLDREFEFAYSEQSGYLSALPARCGSGVEFSALLYLPSLKFNKNAEALRYRSASLGATLFPFLADSCASSDLYILSHSPSHLSSEACTAASFGAMVSKLVADEERAERIIFAKSDTIIIDRAWRAYGILTNARRLSEGELLSLCSDIRICLAACEDPESSPPVCISSLNLLLAEGLNASVSAKSKECRDDADCERERAYLVRKILTSA